MSFCRLIGPLVVLVGLLIARTAGAQPTLRPTQLGTRPADAPRFDVPVELPPLPPEYLQEEHDGLRFAYHPSARDQVRPLVEAAASQRAELGRLLGRRVLTRAEVRFGLGLTDLSRITPYVVGSPSSSFPELSLVVVDLGAVEPDGSEARDALGHGLAHLALDEVTRAATVPRWLHEGLALHLGPGSVAHASIKLGARALRHELLRLEELDSALGGHDPALTLAASAQAADWLGFLLEPERAELFPKLVARLAQGERATSALSATYGAPAARLEAAWRADLARRAVFAPVLGAGLLAAAVLLAASYGLRRLLRARAARTATAPTKPRVVLRPAPAPNDGPRHLVIESVEGSGAGPELRVHVVRIQADDPLEDELLSGRPHPADDELPRVSHEGRWHTLH